MDQNPHSAPQNENTRKRLTPVQWLICIIASIGFAFDIYELLMLPLVVRPALMELVGRASPRAAKNFSFVGGQAVFHSAFVGWHCSVCWEAT